MGSEKDARNDSQLPTPGPSDSPGTETDTLPTSKAERDEWASDITPASETGRFMQRLIADVEQLKAEAAEHHLDLEDVCLQVNARNADVERLQSRGDGYKQEAEIVFARARRAEVALAALRSSAMTERHHA